jgi:NCS1 family nucleobase:cation symporter-1
MTTPDPSQLRARIESSPLYNEDLAPATAERRHWGTYNFAALWISMSVNILTYMLAASLIQGGMNWKQAVATIFLGNVIVLAPMLLNSHPGAKYGIPFPVLARASFGVLGANVAAVLRALVACGWFGIQTWIGGEAISTLLATLVPAWKTFPYGPGVCFFLFWLINLAVVLKGIEYIRILQGISAPILLGVGLLLLGWAYRAAGGFGPMFSVPSRFTNFSDFLKFLIPALNGTVGFWATVSLNIPDFTRFARNQREQMIGQALALPTTMTLYAFVGVVVTSATVVVYGTAIWNPVELLSRFHSPVAVVISLVAILLFHGHRADAVEAALQLQHVHHGMAWRLRRLPRARGRNHDLRLLRHPAAGVAGGRTVSSRRPVRIFARIQLGSHHCPGTGSGHCAGRIGDSLNALFV